MTRFDLTNRLARRLRSSSSPRGEGVVAAALLVSSALALSLIGSGHAVVLLSRIAWVPLIVAGALVASLHPHGLRRLLPWVAAAGLLLAAGDTLYQWRHGTDLFGLKPFGLRLMGPLPHPNDTALWAVLLPWTPLWAWPVAFALIAASASRMALGGALVVVVCMAPRRWRVRLGLTLAIGFVAYVASSIYWGHVGQTNGLARLGMWAVGWEMVKASPLIGWGPASFVDHYLPILRELGPYSFGIHALRIRPEWAFVPWAHNLVVEALAELGVFGLVAFALPLLWAWRQGDRRVRVSIIALLVMGTVDLTMLKPWVVAVYWGLVTLAAVREEVGDVGLARVDRGLADAGPVHVPALPVKV